MKSVLTVLIMSWLMPESLQAQAPVPAGGQFQVNSYTTRSQWVPQVAADAQGNFVVVWSSDGSYGSDTSDSSIQGQRCDAGGNPVGGQFQINSYTTSVQGVDSVAVDPDGDFVVVWWSGGSYGTDTSEGSIQAQLYDSAGDPVGGQFQVNSYTTSVQSDGWVAIAPDGVFIVVWTSYGSYGTDTSRYSIQAQRFDAHGAPLEGQFQVNSYTRAGQMRPQVSAFGQGSFVVVWQSFGSYGTDTDRWSIQGQRYDANGAPVGGQFQVNSYTSERQKYPFVAADAQGDFVVVWESWGSYGTDTSYTSIQAQRYDANGAPLGGQFQINSYTTGGQSWGTVAADAEGKFMVVWTSGPSYGTDTSGSSIQAQPFAADGTPLGSQFQVNSYTTSFQSSNTVAADARGNFVVVWSSEGSYGTDTEQRSIQGQRYSSPMIFLDGFESGDVLAWSGWVPHCSVNIECDESKYCKKNGCDDVIGFCMPRPEMCIAIWDPVCGCDGVTYSNSCAAAQAGVNVAYTGECSP